MITRQGGFNLCVLGRNVTVKIWIHYFVGDTEGNNKWLDQYPGNRDGVQHPYRDCKCSFKGLKNTNPNCFYITLDDIQQDNIRKQNYDDGGKQYFKSVSRYDIKNAFLQQFMPLSDNVHGPFRMMPPELLHTSGSGLIMYMFESLRIHLGGNIDQDYIDQEHIVVSNIIQRQSERDFPRGSMRNGLIDGTKIQLSKRKGNLFQFLCIAHKTKAKTILKNSLQLSDVEWRKFIHFLKSYLAMEEWFHDSNDKDEVHNARDEIAKVFTSLDFFSDIRSLKQLQHNQNAWNDKKCSHTSSFLGVE
jgi:hypothetical protein